MKNVVFWLEATDGNETTWIDRINSSELTLENFDQTVSSGWTGKSLLFDGINDVISLPIENITKRMVELNFNISQEVKAGYHVLFANFEGKSFIAFKGENLELCYQHGSGWKTTGVFLEKGKLINLVYRNDGKIYVDGELVISLGTVPSITTWCIVGATWYNSSFVDNAMFELYSVRIYSELLEDSEILHNYKYEQGIDRAIENIVRKGLICWLDGRTYSGSTVTDRSGKGNNLVLTGTTAQTFDGLTTFIDYETKSQILTLAGAGTSCTLELYCRLIRYANTEAWILHTPSWSEGVLVGYKNGALVYQNSYTVDRLLEDTGALEDNVITITYDSTTQKETVYLNGQLKIPAKTGTNKKFSQLLFREYWDQQKSAWKLHSFKGYNRVLTAEEIKRNYDYEKSISRS